MDTPEPVLRSEISTIVCAANWPLFAEDDSRPMGRWKVSWTEQEVEKLKLLAGTMPLSLIAKELDRTTGAVLTKATAEKLTIIVHTRSGRA